MKENKNEESENNIIIKFKQSLLNIFYTLRTSWCPRTLFTEEIDKRRGRFSRCIARADNEGITRKNRGDAETQFHDKCLVIYGRT